MATQLVQDDAALIPNRPLGVSSLFGRNVDFEPDRPGGGASS